MYKDRNIYIILIFILAFSLLLCGCQISNINHPTLIIDDYNDLEIKNINNYGIKVEFNPEEKTYIGEQIISYVNNTKGPLEEIFIHIYPNAFKSKETAPFLYKDLDKTYEEEKDLGFIDLHKVKINKKKVDYSIQGKGDTILKLNLESPLKSKEKVEIYLEYEAKLPFAQDRFGYGEETFNFGNWYPIVSVYDEDGWNIDPYYSIGDPFYSDISNYEVEIITPKDMIIASSGNILDEKIKGNKKIWNIEGKFIRDFAWVASKNFIVKEKEVEGTKIKTYFLKDNPNINQFAARVSEDSIKIFNKVFGKYPYGHYSVVATDFSGGMEYPGLVFIGKGYYDELEKDFLEKVIVHETAHQWWYGIVGNDQIEEAWLDESLATYSEIIYLDEVYGEEIGKENFEEIEEYYDYMLESYNFEELVVKSLKDFKDWNDYGPLVYHRGAMFLNEIKKDFGEEVLYDILNKYYHRYRFFNAKTEDFISICEEVTGTSFENRMSKWLYNE